MDSPEFTCMTFNVEYGGQANKLQEYIALILLSNPTVICCQEIFSEELYYKSLTDERIEGPKVTVAKRIANALGYFYVQSKVKYGLCILSKFPIKKVITNDHHILAVELINNLNIVNVHFDDEPCTYYSLRGIQYDNTPSNLTSKEAAKLLYGAKKGDLKHLWNSLNDSDNPTLIMGDFNEPSHLDWTKAAVDEKLVPTIVEWKTSKAFERKGFLDVARSLYPSVTDFPLQTVDVVRMESQNNVKERIDFIYSRDFEPLSFDRVLSPLSDHLPLVAKLNVVNVNQRKGRRNSYSIIKNSRGHAKMTKSYYSVKSVAVNFIVGDYKGGVLNVLDSLISRFS